MPQWKKIYHIYEIMDKKQPMLHLRMKDGRPFNSEADAEKFIFDIVPQENDNVDSEFMVLPTILFI
jgi:hypothetical protein